MTGFPVIVRLAKQLAELQQVVDQQQTKLAKANQLLQHCEQALQQNENNIRQMLNQTECCEDSETSFKAALQQSWKLRQRQTYLSRTIKRHIKTHQNLIRELHLTRQLLLAWKKCGHHASSNQLAMYALRLKLEQRLAKLALLLAGYGIKI